MGQIWDFTGLSSEEVANVTKGIAGDQDLCWLLGSEKSMDFIMRNYLRLAAAGNLERSWISTYVHTSHFNDIGLTRLRAIFDACDRSRLQTLSVPVRKDISTERISLFRGCAGPIHSLGMSWTTSLDKAIYYAALHSEHHDLKNLAVYTTTVATEEIYCRLDKNEHEFIVIPSTAWRIDVPPSEFRLDRPRW